MAADEGPSVYPNGQPAFTFLPDGSGFAYYPSGKPAACVSTVSSYQNRFYFYDDAAGNEDEDREAEEEGARKRSKDLMVCALDEYIVGFAVDNSGGDKQGTRMVFTKEGALIAGPGGDIEKEWKWDSGAQNAGTPPVNPIDIHMTKSLTLTFVDKFTISVRFNHEGMNRVFDLGMKLRRMTSYLETSDRVRSGPNVGKLEPRFDHTNLVERQAAFNQQMKAKRNRLNPRSQDLSEKVSGIVADLEKGFDAYSKTHTSASYLEPTRRQAMDKTVSELPRIAITGQEAGPHQGFGESLYVSQRDFDELAQTGKQERLKIPDHMIDEKTGDWKDDIGVRTAVRRVNPLLTRAKVLNDASGRYSTDLVVAGSKHLRTATNPTGRSETQRVGLPVVRAKKLEEFVTQAAGPNQLVTVLCVRGDDRKCRKAEAVAEVVNGQLHRGTLKAADAPSGSGPYDPETAPLRIVKVDTTESREMAAKYKVYTVPFTLMFYGGKIVYGGTMGGEAVRLAATVRPWRVLLVEPNFKDQLITERVLRKRSKLNHWDLAMTAAEAVLHKQKLSDGAPGSESKNYDLALVSEDLPDGDVAIIERSLKGGAKGGASPLLVGMAAMKGEAGHHLMGSVSWEKGGAYTTDTSVLPNRLASAADIAVQKPVKISTMEKIDELLNERYAAAGIDPATGNPLGTTGLDNGKRGKFLNTAVQTMGASDLGFTLASQEAELKGVTLMKSSIGSLSATA